MDLFNNIQGATANIEATAMYVPEKQTKSSLTNWLGVYATFIQAIQERNKEVLSFLLAEKQSCDYWRSRQEFVDKFMLGCEKLERKRPITVNITRGIGFASGEQRYWSALKVEVAAKKDNRPLWVFNLVYHFDSNKKITVCKSEMFIAFISPTQNTKS